MPKGKPWTLEEEKTLKDLVVKGYSAAQITEVMGKSKEAILKKIQRLGLKVVHQRNLEGTTSELIMPAELPSIEEALLVLATAMKALEKPNLSKNEIQRLRSIVQAVKTYKELIADYIGYRKMEAKLLEMEQKYAELAEKAKAQT
jgi:hypothetical protein